MQRGRDAEAAGGRAWPPAGADPRGRSRRRWRLPIVAARHGPGVALPDVVRLEAGLPAAGPRSRAAWLHGHPDGRGRGRLGDCRHHARGPPARRESGGRAVAGIADPDPGPDGFYVSTGRQLLDHPVAAMEVEESFEAGRRGGGPAGGPGFRRPIPSATRTWWTF